MPTSFHAARAARAVFLDIDGTLIGASGHMHQPIVEALMTLRQQRPELHLMICTGRPFGGVAAQVAGVLGGPEVAHIFHGGALTRSAHTIHNTEPLQWAHIRQSLDQRPQLPGATLELYTHDAIFVEHETPLSLGHAQVIGMEHVVADLASVCATQSIIKMQWMLPEPRLTALMQLQHPGLFYAPATCDVMPGVSFVTVTLDDVDKGSAVRGVLDAINLDPEDAIAVGDSAGDLPMLQVVGHPFLMQNAPGPLRAASPHIQTLPDVEAAGVLVCSMPWRHLREPFWFVWMNGGMYAILLGVHLTSSFAL